MAQPWWKAGVRFECCKRGCCCVTHGENGAVFVNADDRRRLAEFLELSARELRSRYLLRTDGRTGLKDAPGTQACVFLGKDGCQVYEARPTQCRTWPFWPENMSARAWKEVAAFCPGIGRGRLWSAEEIEAKLDEQREADEKP
jgi:Fe-S-cluster containining protein